MRLGILSRDIFGGERAVNSEARTIVSSLAKVCELTVVGRVKEPISHISGAQCLEYRSLSELRSRIRDLKRYGVQTVVVQSIFTSDGLFGVFASSMEGMFVVVQDFGSITTAGLQRKLFTMNPDVKVLEAGGRSTTSSQSSWRVDLGSSFKKWLAIYTLRYLDYRSIKAWFTFSSFSDEELGSLVGVRPESCVHYPWAAVQPARNCRNRDWFDADGGINGPFRFVFWSRLDYWMKGIDRMIMGFAMACEIDEGFAANAKLYLIGPDYRGGAEECKKLIDEYGLTKSVAWVKPGEYESGSLDPLGSADAAVLLSRWDGFPRALREAIGLQVPVVVCPETHFGDIVADFGVGSVVSDADEVDQVASALLSVFRKPKPDGQSFRDCYSSLEAVSLARDALRKISDILRSPGANRSKG